MRLFCHTRQFGLDFWGALPSLLLMADDVVCWAPSGIELEKAKASGVSPFAARDVLDMVEKGWVRVAARRPYLEDPKFRSAPGRPAADLWHEEFDGPIKSLMRLEERTNKRGRHVFPLDAEQGYRKADAEIRKKGEGFKIARGLVEKGRVPRDTAERIDRKRASPDKDWKAKPKIMATREILRDAYNHEDARIALRADQSAMFAPVPIMEFARIAGTPPAARTPDLSVPEVLDFLKWIRALPHAGNMSVLTQLRSDSTHREQFWKLFNSRISPASELHDRIKDGLSKASWEQELFGSTPALATSTLISIATGALGASQVLRGQKLSRRTFFTGGAVVAVAGLAGTASEIGLLAARRMSKLADDTYAGPVWPFLLAFGNSQPHRDQITAMLDDLIKRLGK